MLLVVDVPLETDELDPVFVVALVPLLVEELLPVFVELVVEKEIWVDSDVPSLVLEVSDREFEVDEFVETEELSPIEVLVPLEVVVVRELRSYSVKNTYSSGR